jgi:serine/threonine-protein kinase
VNHIKNASKNAGAGYDSFQNTDGRRKTNDVKKVTSEDDEELDAVDPRVEKLAIIGTIAAAIILVLLIIYFVAKFFNLFPDSGTKIDPSSIEATLIPSPSVTVEIVKDTVVMPSVIGLILEDAEDTLLAKSADLNITSGEEFSDTFEKGMVIDQYPKPEAEVDANADVRLVISSGPESFEIPNVCNLTDSQAVIKLEEVELIVKHEFEFSDEIEEGRVISTTPERGSMAVKGDTITVLVSSGLENKEVAVPDIYDLSQAKAKKKLESVGLILGSVSKDYSDTYSEGYVMYQSYEEGTKIALGTAVDITISLGTAVIAEPTKAPSANSFVSQLVISDSPFDYAGESGIIEIELEQDGNLSTLLKEEMTSDNFPLTINNIKSASGSDGTIRMFIGREVDPSEEGAVLEDGKYISYESYNTTWSVEFTPVQE